ncbi:MAG: LLM class flavin-dependent oxidoreductase, partial [Dehalococcoidia bacterium]
AVMLNALRHPVHLAHSIATIDNISDGRIVLGVGAGRSNNQMFVDEHSAVGVPIAERADRMEESIDVLRKLWSGGEVSNPSGFYPFTDVTLEPRPVQEHVPIWISSNWVKRGLRRVAAQGDGWITNVPTTELFIQCWQIIEDRAEELHRDIADIPRCLYISVNLNDEEEALSEGDGFMRAYYSTPYEVISKQLLCVFGPAKKCIDAILRYKEAGADYFIVRFASPNQMEQLERFTETVVPFLD